MSRNRRNKRNQKKITELISLKTFLILLVILILIISISSTIILYRKHQDKLLLAKQREELEKEIEAIFTEASENINNTNNTKRDSIIRISAVGDILCGDEMLNDAKEGQNYDFTHMFSNITSFIKGSDIALGTMETNFTNNTYSGYGNRNSPIEFAKAVKNSGINLVSISTNHSLDYGVEGLKETKEKLQELEFETVGDTLGENSVVIKDIKDTKIAFLSYTYGIENSSYKSKEELNSINIFSKKKAEADLKYARDNSEYIIVIMHWGDLYTTTVSKSQKEIAEFLVENGANIILGNHPAVIQPMEIKKNLKGENVLVAYSLGNYISTINYDNSKIELILNIEIRKSIEEQKVILTKVEYTPLYVLDNGEKAQNRYQLIDMKAVAMAYANGNTSIVSKNTYNKLIEGIKLLENVLKVK
ncbi:MAG: CapA family protein [Clostridia bacterium]